MTVVAHISQKSLFVQRDCVYIGRPSDPTAPRSGVPSNWRWGNPFPIGAGDRARCIAEYTEWLAFSDDPRAEWQRDHLVELRGRTLLCFCAPSSCHGHVLKHLADIEDPDARNRELGWLGFRAHHFVLTGERLPEHIQPQPVVSCAYCGDDVPQRRPGALFCDPTCEGLYEVNEYPRV